MTFVRFAILAFLSVFTTLASEPVVRLTPGTPILIAEPASGPVLRAARDLQRDLASVLGSDSPIVAMAPPDRACIEILPPDSRLGASESHSVRVESTPGRPSRVVLSGSDTRGVIYAIYTFSEQSLGIPPLWFFAQWRPLHGEAVELPAHYSLTVAAPFVRWRGWFPNDEDMFEPWEALNQPEHFDRILETMLRLKLNVIELGDFSDYPVSNGLRRARLARDRGLAITTTHTSPLGTGWSRWNSFWRRVRHQEPPPLRLAQVNAMKQFWNYHINLCRKEGFEMIWEIGFRGNGDHSFATYFPDAPADDAGRARVIQSMDEIQIALVRAHQGNAPLRMRTILYNESSDYLADGLLKLPRDPELIWNYVAARRDHFPAADLRSGTLPPDQPFGYYLNFQFTSTGAHLAQAEGPWKMARNYQMVAAASPLPLAIWTVNVGNFREFIREMSAHASMAWQPAGWDPDLFLNHWCTQYFGQAHAAATAAIIRDFYDSYWTQRAPDLPDFPRQYIFQDMRIARSCEDLLDLWTDPVKAVPLDDRGMGYYRIDPTVEHTDEQMTALTRGLTRSVERLESVAHSAELIEPQLPEDGQRLWHDNTVVQAEVVLAADKALLAVVRGYCDRSSEEDRRRALREADGHLADARRWLSSADQPPFSTWSEPERLWGISQIRHTIALLLAGQKVIPRERP